MEENETHWAYQFAKPNPSVSKSRGNFMEVSCRPEGPDDRKSILAEKWIQRAWRPPVRPRDISIPRTSVYIHTLEPASGSSSRLATVSTILARTGGGKFGNKICSCQLGRAHCQKRLLILYLASSISSAKSRSASGTVVDERTDGWMLFNIRPACSALNKVAESIRTRSPFSLKN